MLKLNENYRLTADSMNVIIQEKQPNGTWRARYFYARLDNCLIDFCERDLQIGIENLEDIKNLNKRLDDLRDLIIEKYREIREFGL